jgi:manganese-dependent inorganic pyrophosphatase
MERTIYITGHRNPDTDSICSTIAYANLKRQLGYDVTPIRLGNINAETNYVLQRFFVEPPQLKYDIKPTIADIEFDDCIIAYAQDPLSVVYHQMASNDKKGASIVNEEGVLIGYVSSTDITHALLSLTTQEYHYLAQTPLNNIAAAVHGTIVYDSGTYHPNGEVVIATSMLGELTPDEFEGRIALSSTRVTSQINAIKAKVALLIATKAEDFPLEVVALAKEYQCSLIVTPLDLMSVATSITQAIPIGLLMTTNLIIFNLYDYLEDVKDKIKQSRFRAYPIVDNNGRLLGTISRYHLLNHQRKQIILVDHNEMAQSIEGLEEAEILEIIDHHKLGDIQTNTPIFFRNEICGCSSTIISRLYEEYQVAISPKMAGLMLSAIISDTMNFHSPTCTKKDIEQAKKLALICGEDLEALAQDLLTAGASLRTKTASEIVNNDIKQFQISSYRLALGQINVMQVSDLEGVSQQVMNYMDSYALANRLDMVVMLFSLINAKGSYALVIGKEAHLFLEAFKNELEINDQGFYFIPEMISRKKQIIPLLSNYLQLRRFN